MIKVFCGVFFLYNLALVATLEWVWEWGGEPWSLQQRWEEIPASELGQERKNPWGWVVERSCGFLNLGDRLCSSRIGKPERKAALACGKVNDGFHFEVLALWRQSNHGEPDLDWWGSTVETNLPSNENNIQVGKDDLIGIIRHVGDMTSHPIWDKVLPNAPAGLG